MWKSGMRAGALDIGAEELRPAASQVGLALMGVERYRDFPGSGSGVDEILGPRLDAESQEVFGEGGLLPPLEVRKGLELLDVRVIEHERVAFAGHPVEAGARRTVGHGGILMPPACFPPR